MGIEVRLLMRNGQGILYDTVSKEFHYRGVDGQTQAFDKFSTSQLPFTLSPVSLRYYDGKRFPTPRDASVFCARTVLQQDLDDRLNWDRSAFADDETFKSRHDEHIARLREKLAQHDAMYGVSREVPVAHHPV